MNRHSFLFVCLLNALVPGLGHAFWREYSFGVFVFLVMILSALLGVVSFLLPLGALAKTALFGVPLLFFAFTFIDLRRVVRTSKSLDRKSRTTTLFLVGALLWQSLSPLAPVNFGLRNFPEIFRQPDNAFSPRFRQGDILVANSLVYRVSLFFVSSPQLYALPLQGEVVRYVDSTGARHIGIAVGFPGEQVEIADGILMAGGVPYDFSAAIGCELSGRVELTMVDPASILVMTVRLGAIEKVEQVPVGYILGKVHKLF